MTKTLEDRRQAKNLSITRISKDLSINYHTCRSHHKGTRRPSFEQIHVYAVYYGVSDAAILKGFQKNNGAESQS